MAEPVPVFIVLEGPEMTYYGDARIHGVYATREEAEVRVREKDPDWSDTTQVFSNYKVEDWHIGESSED